MQAKSLMYISRFLAWFTPNPLAVLKYVQLCNQGVAGSNPAASTIFLSSLRKKPLTFGQLAVWAFGLKLF
jgi:hypothetical protein